MCLTVLLLEHVMGQVTGVKLPYPRVRREAGIVRTRLNSWSVSKNTGSTPGTYSYVDNGPANIAYSGESRFCSDIVTPGFRQIISDGGIVNNPFTSVKCTCTHGGVGQNTQYTGPWAANSAYGIDVTSILRKNDARYHFGDVVPDWEKRYFSSVFPGIDTDYLLRVAKTSALSKVDKNLASGLVGLGELRQTILSLASPLAGIREFIRRWRRGRGPGRTGTLGKELTKALADDYLSLYYGLAPFVRDIESYIDAYVQSGAQRERQTVRGGAEDSTEVSTAVPGVPVAGISHYDHLFTRKVTVSVRSGILHELPPLTWQKVAGVRYSDFFDAAYQLTPWSFFVDYFSNLGKLIGALTPRPGVRYLATWSTIAAEITERAECTGGGVGSNYIWIRSNTEWAQRVIKARVRAPEAVYNHVGLAFKTGDWTSMAKVTAVLSLIIQQLL